VNGRHADTRIRPLSRRNFLISGAWLFAGGLCHGAQAASQHVTSRPPGTPRLGTHGMVLFGGNDGLYGYHLAMFHAPHDRQVLMRLGAIDPAMDATLRKALAERPVLWTLNPERFDLDRLAPGADDALDGFKADVVLGHFERSGRTIHADVALRVDRVVAFRPLVTAASRSALLRYDIVGDGRERFLIKRIEQRPDFDQIVSLRTRSKGGRRRLALRPEASLASPTMAQLSEALSKQAGLVAEELVPLYDDRADLQ
jgi:hypothetical protein